MDSIRPIPIGVEFYKEMIEKGYYYIDKTLLIRDILMQKNKATLFTRPRRFGKTLTQSMLCTFFEKEILPDGTVLDNSHYFHGKKIMDAGEAYTCHMGQYPVIFLSLKSAKQPDYGMAYEMLTGEIVREFQRHRYVLEKDALLQVQKEQYLAVLEQKASPAVYACALQFLSECLEQFHKKKTVILLDEYDVPLEHAYANGFYGQMADFIRSLFESALKTNQSLEFAVITGCLRISRESIFTGLNNLKVVSVLDESYAEYFGFVQQEIDAMLAYYGMTERREEVKEWYNGYLFGNTEVYNPWSMVNYVYDIRYQNTRFPKPYWANTSSNSMIRELVERADDSVKQELEKLSGGGIIEKPVHEEITYADIYKSQDNLWNFLFFTGYLKSVERRFALDTVWLSLKVPNREVLFIYNHTISEWFQQKIGAADFSGLYRAVLTGSAEDFEMLLKQYLRESISFMDSAENFYHGFLSGLFGGLCGYEKLSNREGGEGRYDILLKPYDEQQPAVILQLKRVQRFTQMEAMCHKALLQIEERHYDAELLEEGYPVILKYGICFCKKSCMVKIEK